MFNFFKRKQTDKITELNKLITTEADNGIKLFDLENITRSLHDHGLDVVAIMRSIKSVSALPNGKHEIFIKNHRVIVTVEKGAIINYKIY